MPDVRCPLTRRTMIAYLVSFALLLAAVALRAVGSRSEFSSCWMGSPDYALQANSQLCHTHLTLLRGHLAASLCFLVAAAVAVIWHVRDWRTFRRAD